MSKEEKQQQTNENNKQTTSENKQTRQRTQTQSKSQDPTFTKKELIDGAGAFDVMPEVMAAALYNTDKDDMTKAEAKRALYDYRKKGANK